MPKPTTGTVCRTEDGFTARITLKGRERVTLPLSSCRTEPEAEARCRLVAGLAVRFRRAGVIDRREARALLETAASCSESMLAGVATVASELCGGALPELAARIPTFREVAAEWTSGELHKRFPDHVKDKDSVIDAKRFAILHEIEVGREKLGDLPIDRVTLDVAEAAMQRLPASAKRASTRRQYAQLISRVLALSVYPCRYIAANPLPKGFKPKLGKPPTYTFLYPKEDAALMGETTVPLAFRVLYGFLAREGCREGEALAFRVRDFDLRLGSVSIDENKTDDPRTWALDDGVVRALRAWVELRGAGPDDLMFVDPSGGPLTTDHRLAEILRESLSAAGVDRHELHNDGTNRRKIRVHDLRGTFVTISLATGKSETWVADRTGHQSSQMINRYRRAARSAAELNLGSLAPLDTVIPELAPKADCPAIAHESARPKGFEPLTSGLETLSHDAEITDQAENKPGREAEREPLETGSGQSGAIDPIEAALSSALTAAASAGDFDAVRAIVSELEARRRARSAVVDLDAERAKRGRR